MPVGGLPLSEEKRGGVEGVKGLAREEGGKGNYDQAGKNTNKKEI